MYLNPGGALFKEFKNAREYKKAGCRKSKY